MEDGLTSMGIVSVSVPQGTEGGGSLRDGVRELD